MRRSSQWGKNEAAHKEVETVVTGARFMKKQDTRKHYLCRTRTVPPEKGGGRVVW